MKAKQFLKYAQFFPPQTRTPAVGRWLNFSTVITWESERDGIWQAKINSPEQVLTNAGYVVRQGEVYV